MNPLAKQAVELDRLIHEPARLTLTTLLYAAEEADAFRRYRSELKKVAGSLG